MPAARPLFAESHGWPERLYLRLFLGDFRPEWAGIRTRRNDMATSDKKPGQGASSSISFGDKELIFARELFGKLSSHALSIRDLEGWADGTLPDSLQTALSQEDYSIARRGPVSAVSLGCVIAEEARRQSP
tara:strand:+ start:235 stop:627 length:393 start_codon:yes stop_codon:yes gene_type:complete